jgi:hypothetical protein
MSHLTRGPARSAGIGSQANAFGGRRATPAASHAAHEEAET